MPGLGFILSLFGGSFFKAIGGFFKGVWTFLCTPLGQKIAVVLGILLAGWFAGNMHGHEVEKAHQAKVVAGLVKSIEDPKIGWRVRGIQCASNTKRLSDALNAQNASVAALKAEGDRKTAATAKALQGAQITIAGLDRMIGRLKSQPAPEICTADVPWRG